MLRVCVRVQINFSIMFISIPLNATTSTTFTVSMLLILLDPSVIQWRQIVMQSLLFMPAPPDLQDVRIKTELEKLG